MCPLFGSDETIIAYVMPLGVGHPPHQFSALKAMPIKTDRRDAEGIPRLLHLGWFRPVQCKAVSAQEVRAVLGARMGIQ